MADRRSRQRRTRTYDTEVTLIGEEITYDNLNNPIVKEHKNVVLCDVDSVGSNEFYRASEQGLKPTITFVVHSFEYEGQQVIAYENDRDRYNVIRTYANDYEEIEITCEKVAADG